MRRLKKGGEGLELSARKRFIKKIDPQVVRAYLEKNPDVTYHVRCEKNLVFLYLLYGIISTNWASLL